MLACRDWVQNQLQPALATRLAVALGGTGWRLEVDPNMADGQCLLFHYPSVFTDGAAGYVSPIVKIELGARSDDWPHVARTIRPYVLEHFPALDADSTCTVSVLAAERTFWEKACLLRAGVGERALADTALFRRVAEHREIFFRHSWVDYTTHKPGTLRLAPPDARTVWRDIA
jgi:hypothetical protein